MPFFSNDLGVDLGTANILIYAANKGIVVREPAVVAVDKNTGKILQVGSAARNMLGRTPGNVVAMQPLKGGVISDHEMTVRMLQEFFRTAIKSSLFTKPRVDLSAKQAKALLGTDTPLADIFAKWENRETDHMADIWDTVENRANELLRQSFLAAHRESR